MVPHRTAQPRTLAMFSHPGESAGAGRVGLAGANIQPFYILQELLIIKNNVVYWYNKKRLRNITCYLSFY
jgi:hypothetical protein